jgi:hypothetical protein
MAWMATNVIGRLWKKIFYNYLINSLNFDFTGRYWMSLDCSNGADGRTRTATGLLPLPPQDSVSTNSTTSAWIYKK